MAIPATVMAPGWYRQSSLLAREPPAHEESATRDPGDVTLPPSCQMQPTAPVPSGLVWPGYPSPVCLAYVSPSTLHPKAVSFPRLQFVLFTPQWLPISLSGKSKLLHAAFQSLLSSLAHLHFCSPPTTQPPARLSYLKVLKTPHVHLHFQAFWGSLSGIFFLPLPEPPPSDFS